jgi:large subunit ribosomal protein L29
MKVADIRKMSTTDLTKESNRLREEIAEMRRRLYLGEIDNPRAVRAKRKDLARILTVLSEQFMKEAK